MVLQEGDQHTRRCHAGVVQGVGQIGLAVLALDADVVNDLKRKASEQITLK